MAIRTLKGQRLTMLGVSLVAQKVKCLPTMQETRILAPGWEDPLEKEMALQYSCLENAMDGGTW